MSKFSTVINYSLTSGWLVLTKLTMTSRFSFFPFDWFSFFFSFLVFVECVYYLCLSVCTSKWSTDENSIVSKYVVVGFLCLCFMVALVDIQLHFRFKCKSSNSTSCLVCLVLVSGSFADQSKLHRTVVRQISQSISPLISWLFYWIFHQHNRI